jgi:WD40 repeat protein
MPAASRRDAFVSYAREDRRRVEWLRDVLEARGKEVWVDRQDIPPAAPWRDRIEQGIERANALVFLLSPDSLGSPECRQELDRALALNKRLVPVLLRDVDPAAVPTPLAAPNWIELRERDDAENGLAQLIEALESDLAWRDAHSRLTVRAQEWEAAERDASFLLRGRDLSAAESWLGTQGTHEEAPTAAQVAYVVASRRATVRRQRITLGAVAAALVVTLALAAVALVQRHEAVRQAHTAQSRELAAAAIAQLDADPALSLLLARESARIAPTAQATAALRRAIAASKLTAVLRTPAPPTGPPSVSADGRWLVQAGADRVARVWDMRTRRRVATLRGHRNPSSLPDYVDPHVTLTAAIAPDGDTIAVGGDDGRLNVWDRRSGRVVRRLLTPEVPGTGTRTYVGPIAFSPDARLLAIPAAATSFAARGVVLWDWRAGTVVRRLPHAEAVAGALAFSRTGTRLVTSATGGTTTVWDVRSGDLVGRVLSDDVHDAAISPSGRYVATASLGGDVEVWNVAGGMRRERMRVADQRRVTFGRDDATVITSGDDGRVRMWRWPTQRLLATLAGHQGFLFGATVDARGEIFTSGNDLTVRRWQPPDDPDVLPSTHGMSVDRALFSPDGRVVALTGVRYARKYWRSSRRVELRDARSGRLLRIFDVRRWFGGDHGNWLHTAFSADGRWLAGASDDQYARVWDRRTGRLVSALLHPSRTYWVGAAAFSPDGRLLATTGSDGAVRVWEWRERRVLARMRMEAAPPGYFPSSVAFHPDGDHIVAVDDDVARVWDWRNRQQVAHLRVPEGISGAVLDRAGERAVIAGRDGIARVWEWRTGRLVAELRTGAALLAADFSRDGSLVLAAEGSGGIGVWDWAIEERIARFQEQAPRALGYDPGVRDARFAPDGRSFVVAGADERAHVYRCDVCGDLPELEALARARSPRAFTPEERRRYLHAR